MKGFTPSPNPTDDERALEELDKRISVFAALVKTNAWDRVAKLQMGVLKADAGLVFAKVMRARQDKSKAEAASLIKQIKQAIEKKGRGWKLVADQMHTPIDILEATLDAPNGPRLLYLLKICDLLGLKMTLSQDSTGPVQ